MSTTAANRPSTFLNFEESEKNVGHTERNVSAAAGGLFLAHGLLRGSFLGGVCMLLGGGLIYRALSGHCPVYEGMGVSTVEGANRGKPDLVDDGAEPDVTGEGQPQQQHA